MDNSESRKAASYTAIVGGAALCVTILAATMGGLAGDGYVALAAGVITLVVSVGVAAVLVARNDKRLVARMKARDRSARSAQQSGSEPDRLRCANCERVIGKLETPHLYREQVVCAECDKRLRAR